MLFIEDDGGCSAAGLKTGSDCVARAIAIATGLPYPEVAEKLWALMEPDAKRGRIKKKRGRWHHAVSKQDSRHGVHRRHYAALLKELGWEFHTTCGDWLELPMDDSIIVSMPRHLAALVHGELRDTWNCAQKGRKYLGYWYRP